MPCLLHDRPDTRGRGLPDAGDGLLGLPRHLAEFIGGLNLSPFVLILMLTGFFIVLGCFLDGISMVVLTMAVLLPTVQKGRLRPDLVPEFSSFWWSRWRRSRPGWFQLVRTANLTKREITYLARTGLCRCSC